MHAAFQTVRLFLVLIPHSIGRMLLEKERRDSIAQGALREAHETVRATDAAFKFSGRDSREWRPGACLGVAKVASHAAEDGAPIAQPQAALLKAQADAGPDSAKRLEGQGLRVVQAEQRGHQLLQLVLGRLPQDQSVLLQPSQSHDHWSVPSNPIKRAQAAIHISIAENTFLFPLRPVSLVSSCGSRRCRPSIDCLISQLCSASASEEGTSKRGLNAQT